jgi:hypothetical protein
MDSPFRRKLKKLLTKAKERYKERGICDCIRSAAMKIRNWITFIIQPYWYKISGPRTFTFQGKNYSYFYNNYNRTWRNERAVEVPIIWEVVKQHAGKNILEVGNVLSHYFPVDHDIVDKYEKANDVINQDVVDFNPDKKYDLVVSISTLEHVGWDENPKEPYRVLRAIENLKKLLASNGKIIATIPWGYNAELDILLQSKKISFTEMYCLKGTVPYNKWIETDWSSIRPLQYDFSVSSAKALVILVL